MKTLIKNIIGNFKIKKREPFECPYDLKSCDYVDTSTMTIAIKRQDCKRYNHGIRPSKF